MEEFILRAIETSGVFRKVSPLLKYEDESIKIWKREVSILKPGNHVMSAIPYSYIPFNT
jgi:hypothetical protein